ncbi:hypothetical protein ScalyP_jg4503, partial [Parmales sp. scaly parma]
VGHGRSYNQQQFRP